jgi:hypothetical protein
MDRAIRGALRGRDLLSVEETTRDARGLERAHEPLASSPPSDDGAH